VACVPGGKRVVSCGFDRDHTVRVWDIETGKELVAFEGHTAGPTAVAVTPDGKYAVSCGKDGTVRVWRMPK
jgi:WD40 repeat protein